jgi:hypothetical protein
VDDLELFLSGLDLQDDARASAELFTPLATFVNREGLDVDLSSVPEPSAALGLLGLGACGLLRRRHRRYSRA